MDIPRDPVYEVDPLKKGEEGESLTFTVRICIKFKGRVSS
jgi:hypothetical protein